MNPRVKSFHDRATGALTYVVYDRAGKSAAVIDPVLDYDAGSARTSTASADRVLEFLREQGLTVNWILETHAHADHLTSAAYLKKKTGAKTAIGAGITQVQAYFSKLYGLDDFAADGSQFDQLFAEGDSFRIGELEGRVIATPGHTDDSLTYIVGDAAFIGDTLFAPARGTARADFPGGDARKLYRSIRKLLDLRGDTRLFLCHDYPAAEQDVCSHTSVDEQKLHNIHVGGQATEESFVNLRNARDATLSAPRLILPALQVNIRAGELPPQDANGIRYLRLPLNQLDTARA